MRAFLMSMAWNPGTGAHLERDPAALAEGRRAFLEGAVIHSAGESDGRARVDEPSGSQMCTKEDLKALEGRPFSRKPL
jgi:hypothetical protein